MGKYRMTLCNSNGEDVWSLKMVCDCLEHAKIKAEAECKWANKNFSKPLKISRIERLGSDNVNKANEVEK